MNDEERGEGRVMILDVERDGLAVEFLEAGFLGVVDEYELADLWVRVSSRTCAG